VTLFFSSFLDRGPPQVPDLFSRWTEHLSSRVPRLKGFQEVAYSPHIDNICFFFGKRFFSSGFPDSFSFFSSDDLSFFIIQEVSPLLFSDPEAPFSFLFGATLFFPPSENVNRCGQKDNLFSVTMIYCICVTSITHILGRVFLQVASSIPIPPHPTPFFEDL